MSHFLVFRLYAPMMSFGEVAVGEKRSSSNWPTRSAVLGLVAAAMGILRTEEGKLQKLSESLVLGLCQRNSGVYLRDYHTIQMPPQTIIPKKTGLFTRKQELEIEPDSLKAMLSTREYLCDSIFDVALQGEMSLLNPIHESLLNPKFTLYLGRKSCPIGLPLGPKLWEAEDFMQAIEGYHQDIFSQWPEQSSYPLEHILRASSQEVQYQWEPAMMAGSQKITRYDKCVSREKWLFVKREVYQGAMS